MRRSASVSPASSGRPGLRPPEARPAAADGGRAERVLVGELTGLYGVRGWVRVYSYTEPRENILNYRHWVLERDGESWPAELAEGRRQGKGVVARLRGVQDRDAAARWLGARIHVARSELPALAEGEYYWSDLEGLEVLGPGERPLGRVHHLFETGANDVMVVRGRGREILIPYLPGRVVRQVDLESGRILVDWEPGD